MMKQEEDNAHANCKVSISSIVKGRYFVSAYEEAKYGFPFNYKEYDELTQDDQFDYEWGRQLAAINPNLIVSRDIAKRNTVRAFDGASRRLELI